MHHFMNYFEDFEGKLKAGEIKSEEIKLLRSHS